MGKYFKWSALATIVLSVIYYFTPSEINPLTLDFFGSFSVSLGRTAPNFFNLIFIIPTVMLLAYISKKDERRDTGVSVVSIGSIVMSLAFVDSHVAKYAVLIYAVIALLVFIISLYDCDGHKDLFLRIIFSTALTFLVHTVIFGFYNGLLIAGYVLVCLIAMFIIGKTIGYIFVFFKNLPKNTKLLLSWMSK